MIKLALSHVLPVNNIKKSLLTIHLHTCFKISKNYRGNSGRIFSIFFLCSENCIYHMIKTIYIVMKPKWNPIIVMTSNLSEVLPVYDLNSSFPACCPELPQTSGVIRDSLLRQNLCYSSKVWSVENLIYNLESNADLYLWLLFRRYGYKVVA